MIGFYTVVGLASTVAAGAHELIPPPKFHVHGQGTCKPDRPTWQMCNGANFSSCQHACLSSVHCIGFDYDPASDGCCHVRLTSAREAARNVPAGFTTISGEEGDDFITTALGGSSTATCYERVDHKKLFLKYGNGTCGGNRPQQAGYLTFPACKQLCIKSNACIGFDYDHTQVYCRLHFRSHQDTKAPLDAPYGMIALPGNEGPGFVGTTPSAAECYVKADMPFSDSYSLLVYGSGNCQPARPQWEYCQGADFQLCQQTCLRNDKCIGFDFDHAFGGCCRIHFSSNHDAQSSSKPQEFRRFTGEEGPGFSGSSGPASATCYVKPNHPFSTKYDLFVYGPGNCQPSRPEWTLGNPATFGVCQQTCLKKDDCMGFDYDPAFGGYCRLSFATDKHAFALTADDANVGFHAKSGTEGYGFEACSGQHGTEAATCYVKPAFPGLDEDGPLGGFKTALPALLTACAAFALSTAIVLKLAQAKGRSVMKAPLITVAPEGSEYARMVA
mmetsp:Transcript_130247/g.212110  ORF Transcript_130247/g.212110 Transcript_130247/m.212110 type:complete len:500 (+) Transcript_130247:104-1603(+)